MRVKRKRHLLLVLRSYQLASDSWQPLLELCRRYGPRELFRWPGGRDGLPATMHLQHLPQRELLTLRTGHSKLGALAKVLPQYEAPGLRGGALPSSGLMPYSSKF